MVLLAASLGAVIARGEPASELAEPRASQSTPTTEVPDEPPITSTSLPWQSDLPGAQREALAKRRPILVRMGGEFCPWCKKLEAEIETPAVQGELARWILVYLDLDRAGEAATRLNVSGVPALRVLGVRGGLIAARDGYLDAAALLAWLQQNYEAASAAPDESLFGTHEPKLVEVVRVVRLFGERDPAVREAAVRRLVPYPTAAAPHILKTLREGNLSAKLAAYEVLGQWKAPLEEIDPWRPETLTAERLMNLERWLETVSVKTAPPAPGTLAAVELQNARDEIDRMLKAEAAAAAAARERLAQFGPALLPEVYERLKNAATDDQRQKLLALRYRLVASPDLPLRWPGGLERLADADMAVRHQAADELAQMATPDLERLLLELFSDPDSLVREISLRGLRNSAGEQATSALVKLLEDPEPNVRAAVLKQLAEDAPPELVDEVAAYVKQESDPDLIVHAIRFFGEVKVRDVTASVLPLLEHANWQVRAEAAQVLAKRAKEGRYTSFGQADGRQEEIREALLKLLDDSDAFVVARALEGLEDVKSVKAVEPLIQAAKRHPALTPQIAVILANNANMREQSLPHLRRFFQDQNAAVRAAAIGGLARADSETIQQELLTAFGDPETEVRTAAAEAVLAMLRELRPSNSDERLLHRSGIVLDNPTTVEGAEPVVVEEMTAPSTETDSGGGNALLRGLKQLLRLPTQPLAPETDAPQERKPDEPNADVPLTEPGPAAGEDGSRVGRTASRPPEPAEPRPDFRPPDLDALLKDLHERHSKPVPDSAVPTIELPAAAGETSPEGGESDATAAESDASRLDAWLADLYQGEHRPPWMSELIAPLQRMLAAAEADERVAAVLALIPLGQGEAALPVLLSTAKGHPASLPHAAQAFAWLVWPQREALFRQLDTLATTDDERAMLVQSMNEVSDRRIADLYWPMLAREGVGRSEVSTIEYGLRQAYLGSRYYDEDSITPKMRREAREALVPHAQTGRAIERLVAINLLFKIAADDALQAARTLLADTLADADLRRDAFQITLAAQAAGERVQTAIETLQGDDPGRRIVALKFLAIGVQALRYLPATEFSIDLEDGVSISSGEPIIPEPPKRLTAADVRPFLNDPNAEMAAYAGYLLALFGEREGLDVLLRYWRSRPEPDESLDRLVYRAIAVTDDPQYIPLLRDIVHRLDEYDVREFYWTIRIMSGPEILQFRKEVRAKYGMEHLR